MFVEIPPVKRISTIVVVEYLKMVLKSLFFNKGKRSAGVPSLIFGITSIMGRRSFTLFSIRHVYKIYFARFYFVLNEIQLYRFDTINILKRFKRTSPYFNLLLAGLFAMLLPETLNRKMPETVADVEEYGRMTKEKVSKHAKDKKVKSIHYSKHIQDENFKV